MAASSASVRPRAAASALSSASSSSAAAGAAPGGSAIQVVVRLRPMNASEEKDGTLPVVTAKTSEKSVAIIKGKGRKQLKSSYAFDDVFGSFSTQEEVFDATVKPVIADVMRGFESTVFAYGQTGTGKTHTMEGSLSKPELHGVIPRSARAIFEHLKLPGYKRYRVTCSCLEIYNEELRDLLLDGNNNNNGNATAVSASPRKQRQHGGARLDIMDGKNGTFCRGLTEKQVRSASDVLALLRKAQHSRHIGETKMNKSSSRSHCLFTIQVRGTLSLNPDGGDDDNGETLEFDGKLHMVDLAGSECAKSAGNDKGDPGAGARERERMNINRSLLTLGRVITVLKEKVSGKNPNARIPYRDSKLTRVLQESLGGRCKTIIVATLSPSITAIEESLSTLNYAHSANGIVNKPVSSSSISLGANMRGANSTPSEASSPAPTVESWREMDLRLQYMQGQVDEAQAALARKHLQQQELHDRVGQVEKELSDSRKELCDANKENETLKGVLEDETNKRKETEKVLNKTQVHLKNTEMILTATQATESSLTMEARTLIEKLEEMIADRNDMHTLVTTQWDAELQQKEATKQFQEAAFVVLNKIESSLTDLIDNIETSHSSVINIATANHEVGCHSVSETQNVLSDIAKNVSCVTNSIKSQLAGQVGIVPILEARSNSVLSVMHSAKDEFVSGEKSLEESCDATRNRLDQCTKMLEERASNMQTSTGQALQSFESNVIESKNAIAHLVQLMKNSLSNLSEAKFEKAKAMDSLAKQWRDQSVASSKTLLDATTSSSVSLKRSINSFQKEMHNHQVMKTSLENQRSFLDTTGSAHMQTIHQQSSLLNAHRQKLAQSHDAQSKLRDEVMQSILSGVQSLVSSEIEKLAQAETNHFQLLDDDGIDLASTNERITQSAKHVAENMASTNRLVSDKASILYTNDMKASEKMQSSQSSFEGAMASLNAHQKLTTDFASKSLAVVSEMRRLDGQNAEIIKMAETDGEAVSASLVTAVLEPASSEMNKALKASLDALAYVNEDVVSNVNGVIEDVAESRKSVASQIVDKFESASSQLVDMTECVVSMAKTQHGAAERLGDETLAASDTHEKECIPNYYVELDSGKEKLLSTMAYLGETSSHVVSEGKAQGSIVKQLMEDFSHNKIQCSKPPDPVPPRKECNVSHDLSSTPAENEILKGADYGIARPHTPSKEDSERCTPETSISTPPVAVEDLGLFFPTS